ncbi:MAG: helix-turn-helix domain-containing protein [Wohlfahrtiimonas sp.]
MSDFFDRLVEEREKKGLSAEAFGAIAGVRKATQYNYEKGERKPDIEYLANLSKVGVDVQYIITGVKFDNTLSPHEEELILALRASKPSLQMMAMASAHAVLESGKIQENRTINQHGGQYSEGNIQITGDNYGGNKNN